MLRGNWSILSLYIYTGHGVWCVCERFDVPFYCICSHLVWVYSIFLYFVGASLNLTDEYYGLSPLHRAAEYDNLKVAQLLLRKGVLSFFTEFLIGAYIKMLRVYIYNVECSMEEGSELLTPWDICKNTHVARVFSPNQPMFCFVFILYWIKIRQFCTRNGAILTEVWVENGVIDLSITISLPYTFVTVFSWGTSWYPMITWYPCHNCQTFLMTV